jgi:cell division protein FtsB
VASAAAVIRDQPTLTGRAVVLAAVLGLLVFTLAVPLRELFHQRADISALHAGNAATQLRVDELTQREERLQDPAYVTSLIRERLHYVLPGEVGYVVLDPAEAPAPSRASAAPPHSPWYSTLWQAVETTDQAGVPAAVLPGVSIRPGAPR